MALLAKDNDAVAVPDACGRNVTVKGTDPPAATMAGKEIPLRTNSALLLLAEEIVTGEFVAVRVPDSTVFDPVATLPKFRVAGATLNCPTAAPLPDSAMFNFGFGALEVIASCPETASRPARTVGRDAVIAAHVGAVAVYRAHSNCRGFVTRRMNKSIDFRAGSILSAVSGGDHDHYSCINQ